MKSSPMAAPSRFLINASFDDFDAFTEAAREWKLDFMQLDRGRFRGRLKQCGVAGAQIGRAVFNRKLSQQGESPEGMRTFVVPVNRDLSLNWRRQDVGGNDLLVFPEGRELTSISNDSFDVVTLSVEDALLNWAIEQWGDAETVQLIHSQEVIALGAPACAQLSAACLSYYEGLERDPDRFVQGGFDEELRLGLTSKLVQAISSSLPRQGSAIGLRKRSKALKLAHDAIVEHAQVPITVKQLCSITGASERTLQYAFQEKYGLTPKTYIQAYRLNQVRKVLRASSVLSRRVVDVANDWGFWHMGQFAKDYQRLFGELPSATLRG